MRLPRPFLSVLLAVLAAAGASAHEGHSPATATSADLMGDALQAAQAVEAFSAALAAGRMDGVRGLLDPAVQVFENGHVEAGREAYFAEHAAADAEFLATATVTRESRAAGASGDTAWVATRSTIARAGKRYASLETMVLRRGAEGWRIVHIHWSSRELK